MVNFLNKLLMGIINVLNKFIRKSIILIILSPTMTIEPPITIEFKYFFNNRNDNPTIGNDRF